MQFLFLMHIDHYGLIEHIQETIPVYAGEGTKRIFHINSVFLDQEDLTNPVESLCSGQSFKIGSLSVTPYLMDHSAFDAYAFVIEGGDKSLIYSGDFRSHGRKAKAFEYFLKMAPKGSDVLLLEGSVLGRSSAKTLTESDIQKKTTELLKSSDNIVFVYPSSQNVDRLVSFYKAASESKRLFVIDVYAANVLDMLKDTPGVNKLPHPSLKYGNIKVYFPPKTCDLLGKRRGRWDLMTKFRDYKITHQEISEKPGAILMAIRPSVLNYISKIKGIEGSTVIYSMWEGYKEERSMKRFFAFLERNNMNMIDLHTSGHASISTLRRVAKTLQPKKLIPVHTFYPEQYASLFSNVLLADDGQEIML